jgi:hypothetical protein
MTLIVELPPEMERRLEEEAARRGQDTGAVARALLEEKLASLPPGERTWPRASAAEVAALLEAAGTRPVSKLRELEGDFWPDHESVDEFLQARRVWQSEGGAGFPWGQGDVPKSRGLAE